MIVRCRYKVWRFTQNKRDGPGAVSENPTGMTLSILFLPWQRRNTRHVAYHIHQVTAGRNNNLCI